MKSLEDCVPHIRAAGFEDQSVFEIGCPYISAARARMLGRALKAGFDAIVFIDHDLSWEPSDMVKLLQTPGDVVGGTYRFKTKEVRYMGCINTDDNGIPICRADGCISADRIPAGFLKISRSAIDRFSQAYPNLVLEKEETPSVDLFNHGARDGVWWGEDYAFCRRWRECGGEVWLVPDLNLTHHGKEPFPGNFHEFLLRQPGGSKFDG